MTETKVDHLNEARVAMQRYPGGEKATEHDANRAIAHALIALVEEVRGLRTDLCRHHNGYNCGDCKVGP